MGLRPSLALVALTAALLAVAACGTEERRAESPAASEPAAGTVESAAPALSGEPILGLLYPENTSVLAELDPLTLVPVRQVDLGVSGWPHAFSPDGRTLALGAGELPSLVLVDVESLRVVRDLELDIAPSLAELAWPEPDRLLALSWPAGPRGRAALLDPADGRALERWPLPPGFLSSVERIPGGFVLLLSPPDRIGPATLAVVDAGGVRSVPLGRIRAGAEPLGEPEADPIIRQRRPDLAVDPESGKAYIVGAGEPVAEVDLETMAVAYHELERKTSLLSRILGWLEPAAQAKAIEGPERQAVWLGNGRIAVSGYDYEAWVDDGGGEQLRADPAGLELIDVRDWTVRTVDEDAGGLLALLGGRLLAFGAGLYSSAEDETAGFGLRVYGLDGERLHHLFGDRPVYWVEAAGQYAYAGLSYGPVEVVDLAAGRVVGEAAGQLPTLLDPTVQLRY